MRVIVSRLVLALSASMLVVISATPAVAQEEEDDGLRLETSSTFTLDPQARAVRVTVDVTAMNELSDPPGGYYYFDEIVLPALFKVTNVAARRVGGDELRTRVEPAGDARWSALHVELSPILRSGQTQQIRVTYHLPDLPPRSTGWTRASPAYATFSAYCIADNGLADVEVVIPSGYVVDYMGSEMLSDTADGATVYRATDIADPATWIATFVARNDALLERRPMKVGDRDVVLRAWPGDTAWVDFVQSIVSSGVPALENLIGQPWPVADELQIVETSTPDLYGYGGWYDERTDVIEISDSLDPRLVLHELAHAWFNSTLFVDRWFTEGLAEDYAWRALPAGQRWAPPTPPPADHPGEQPLSAWQHGDLRGELSLAHEEYAYATSWWLVHELVEDVGTARMTDVIDTAAESVIAYQGDPEPERWPGENDWRRALDLVEEVGRSTEAGELFATYVADPADKPLLAARAAARELYGELVAAGAGWTAPYGLRNAMGQWRFDQVGTLIDRSAEVLDRREAVLAVVDDLGVLELPALEDDYETTDDVDAVVGVADRYDDVAAAIEYALESGTGELNPLETVGLLGADVEGDLRAAAATLAAGDVDAARRLAGEAAEQVDEAAVKGAGRYVSAALLVAGVVLAWRLRESRVGSDGWVVGGSSWSRSASPRY
ncbi:MAG: hypothetical protein ICV70_00585 [Jiangellaceae bacterium]|nr:hypothetical protein [Jiangellaceae bacterium]